MSQSTGCDSPLLFEEIYSYYAQAEAWYVAPGAQTALQRLKDSGGVLSLLDNLHLSLHQHHIQDCTNSMYTIFLHRAFAQHDHGTL